MLIIPDAQSGTDSSEPSTTTLPERTPLIHLNPHDENAPSSEATGSPTQSFTSETSPQKRYADEQEHHAESLHKRMKMSKKGDSEMEKTPSSSFSFSSSSSSSASFSRNDTNLIFESERVNDDNSSNFTTSESGSNSSSIASTSYSDQITYCETKDGFEENDLLTHEKKNSILSDENDNEKVNREEGILTNETVNEETKKINHSNGNDDDDDNNDDVINKEHENEIHEEVQQGQQGQEREEEEEEEEEEEVYDEWYHNLMKANFNKERMFNLLTSEKSEEGKVILRGIYTFFEQLTTLLSKEVCLTPEQLGMYQKVLRDRRRRELVKNLHMIFYKKFEIFKNPSSCNGEGEAINKTFFLSLNYMDRFFFSKGINKEIKSLDKSFYIMMCIFIAMNMENSSHFNALKGMLDEHGKLDEVPAAEFNVLKELGFNLSVVTPMEFLRVLAYCDPDVDGQLYSVTSPFYTKELFQEILFQILNQDKLDDEEEEEEEEEKEKKEERERSVNDDDDNDDEKIKEKELKEEEEKEKEVKKEEEEIKEEEGGEGREEKLSHHKVPIENIFNFAVGTCGQLIYDPNYLTARPSRVACIAWSRARLRFGLPEWSDYLESILSFN